MSQTQASTTELDGYTLPDEEVETAVVGTGRTVAVTDRRYIEINEGTTSSGRSVETVEETLFSAVDKVNVDIRSATTETDGTMILLALISGILGFFAAVYGADEGGSGAVFVGLLLLGAAVWLYLNATEKVPGGISIRFKYVTDDGWVHDSYQLPEDNIATAHAAARAVASPHGPADGPS
ncbi:hypothetical protein [Halovivax gelatinilyticus]|uniref:hypothetical protein n=1 Tax=Halovivax gelatinilyticus TaxID=2961597 RepID=UPI0020CA8D0A|nr:hypothetical protein [Halovivax gelatinilyticus]